MATKTFKIGLSNADKQNMAQDVYERLIAMCFDEYDSTKTYNKGDFVVYENPSDTFKLYKCNSDNVTGAWDSSKWDLATFQDLVDDIESAVAFVNDKANVDGNYPTMTVGVADQLSPYDDESGDDQEEPFSFQATGTGNGTQPDFSTGSIALMKEKQGNTVVVNQLIIDGNFPNTTNWNTGNATLSVNSNVATFTASAHRGYIVNVNKTLPKIANHKVLMSATVKSSQIGAIRLYTYGGYMTRYNTIANAFENITFVFTTNSSWGSDLTNNNTIYFEDMRQSDWDAIQVKDVFCIDLTQWFNGDIPQDLLDNPDHFFRYYQGSLAYNEGELVNANGRYIKCIGMNQWDEETELGSYNTLTGEKVNDSSKIRNKNPISVIPNTQYVKYSNNNGVYWLVFYDANMNYIERQGINVGSNTFTTPSNACYMNMLFESAYGTTYNNDISINLYYEDEARCLTYEPYEVLTNNDTGTEVLRSAGSAKDYKTPDGTIHRLVGVVDLGTLTFAYNNAEGHKFFYAEIPTLPNTDLSYLPNLTCSKYNVVSYSIVYNNTVDKTISTWGDTATIRIYDSGYSDATAFKTAMSGVYLFYELATPTTEQGTSYSENLVIDDFGSMDFGGTNGVPQGNLIFYPVDYKAFIDTLYNYTEGTPSNIALKSDLAVVNEKIGAKIPECPTTTDGTYVLKATVADGEVVYNWVLEE